MFVFVLEFYKHMVLIYYIRKNNVHTNNNFQELVQYLLSCIIIVELSIEILLFKKHQSMLPNRVNWHNGGKFVYPLRKINKKFSRCNHFFSSLMNFSNVK